MFKKVILLLIFLTSSVYADLTVYFIDVGQGDAEFIVLPNSKTVLIDGGPSNSNSSNLASFLNAHNITTIDYVILTHPHDDHHKGLQWVFDNCQINTFYDTKMNNSGASGDETTRAKASSETGCTIVYPSANDNLVWDSSVTVKVLNAYPNSGSSSDGTAINQSSIVLKLTYNGESILLAGDIDTNTEATLVSTYGNDLSAKILKVAHHGSSYGSSSSFLNKVQPEKAYIEVGAGNSYGHPDSGTISRLQSAGATVYRTDTSGTMSYTISSMPAGDTVSPAIPTNLTALSVSSTTISLSWTASTDNIGVAGYRIIRDTVFITSNTSTSYSDNTLLPGTTYIYNVSAFDSAGNISGLSNTATVTTNPLVDNTAPTVTNISASVYITSATVTWTTDELSDSQIQYGTVSLSLNLATILDTILATSHSQHLTGLQAGTQYYYQVKSKDSSNNLKTSSENVFTTSNTGTSTNNNNSANTGTNSEVKESDYAKPAELNFGGTSGIKKKIKELKRYKDALK